MTSASYRRLYNIAAAVLLARAAGLWLQMLAAAQHKPLYFDDAYMFARYAANIRHGLGLSWNLDGAHTYGPTSLLWAMTVLVFSYLPVGTWKMLTIASSLCTLGAVAALAWATAKNAVSGLFSSTWRVLPVVAITLADNAVFAGNQATGMETMLATMLAALFLGLALAWRRGQARPEVAALVGVLLYLTRPEAALVVVLMPLLLFFLLPGPSISRGSLVKLLGVFSGGVLAQILLCKLYFHTTLPLSFYMKSRHGYEGYAEVWHPELMLLAFFGACQLYLVAMIFLARRRDLRLIVCCIAPALAVFAYLGTVTQIMGFNSRYYVPYFPFFIVPALLVVNRWLGGEEKTLEEQWPRRTLLTRCCVAAAVMLFFISFSSAAVQDGIGRLKSGSHFEYSPAKLEMAATTPLPPQPWEVMTAEFTDRVVAPLPTGATVAATEVGYLGSKAGQVNIIDMAGLNDTEIALHGFDTDALLRRKPDLIWMPHTSYTFQRGRMFADPALLAQYDLYAGAANFGVAVRKDSPLRAQIDERLQAYWQAEYPQFRMSDYRVTSATWAGVRFKVSDK